ncbi:MAG: vWA domain-containing protein [Patescibacteria group bacterium]
MARNSSEDSVLFARSALHQQQTVILRPNQPTNLAILLLDRSGSMAEHGQTPLKATNELLQTLQTIEGRETVVAAVFTFGDEVSLDVRPQPVMGITPLKHYRANGGTKLYEAVYGALFVGLEFQATAAQKGSRVTVAVSVISDGQDTASGGKFHAMLLELARQAKGNGFNLQVVGIGVDSRRLARDLGFDEACAQTVQATEEGVEEATTIASTHFENSVLFSLHDLGEAGKPKSKKSGEDSDSYPR